jgi:nitrate/TMAO reductase-like tetraheme cytochrome c subunit
MQLFKKMKGEVAGAPVAAATGNDSGKKTVFSFMKPAQKFFKKINLTILGISVACAILIIGVAGFGMTTYAAMTPSFCAVCHNMASHVTSYQSSNHLDNVHAQANVLCKDCHSSYTMIDEAKSLVSYVTGNYKEIFSKRKVGNEMCLKCHINNTFQAIKTSNLVRNPHDGHFPDLTCNACHKAHASQVNYCAQCHENGGQKMIEAMNSKTAPVALRAKNMPTPSTSSSTK